MILAIEELMTAAAHLLHQYDAVEQHQIHDTDYQAAEEEYAARAQALRLEASVAGEQYQEVVDPYASFVGFQVMKYVKATVVVGGTPEPMPPSVWMVLGRIFGKGQNARKEIRDL